MRICTSSPNTTAKEPSMSWAHSAKPRQADSKKGWCGSTKLMPVWPQELRNSTNPAWSIWISAFVKRQSQHFAATSLRKRPTARHSNAQDWNFCRGCQNKSLETLGASQSAEEPQPPPSKKLHSIRSWDWYRRTVLGKAQARTSTWGSWIISNIAALQWRINIWLDLAATICFTSNSGDWTLARPTTKKRKHNSTTKANQLATPNSKPSSQANWTQNLIRAASWKGIFDTQQYQDLIEKLHGLHLNHWMTVALQSSKQRNGAQPWEKEKRTGRKCRGFFNYHAQEKVRGKERFPAKTRAICLKINGSGMRETHGMKPIAVRGPMKMKQWMERSVWRIWIPPRKSKKGKKGKGKGKKGQWTKCKRITLTLV